VTDDGAPVITKFPAKSCWSRSAYFTSTGPLPWCGSQSNLNTGPGRGEDGALAEAFWGSALERVVTFTREG